MTEIKKLKVFVWDLSTEPEVPANSTRIGVQEEGRSGRAAWRRGQRGGSCRTRRIKGWCPGAQELPLCRAEPSLLPAGQTQRHRGAITTLGDSIRWFLANHGTASHGLGIPALGAKALDLC